MKGAYQIRVKNNRNSYMFELRRNITILRGESGRGKTTLFDMIYEFNRFGKNSGVAVSCDREMIALSGDDWENVIEKNPGTIIVIDEDSQFIRSKDFATALRGSDNYFLLITRNYLADLPISVDEIYEHGFGDFDYGYRLLNAGGQPYIASDFVGTCDRNSKKGTWEDPSIPLKERIKKKNSPVGQPFASHKYFLKKWFPTFWPYYLYKPYARILVTSAIHKVRR